MEISAIFWDTSHTDMHSCSVRPAPMEISAQFEDVSIVYVNVGKLFAGILVFREKASTPARPVLQRSTPAPRRCNTCNTSQTVCVCFMLLHLGVRNDLVSDIQVFVTFLLMISDRKSVV